MNTQQDTKRILCYGDSNTWGWVPMGMGTKRFGVNERWTTLLQSLLGDTYEVIEEGLGGRTTVTDDTRPAFPERNGFKSLQGILESHLPLNLVVVMLGTTECKEGMNISSDQITEGIQKIVELIQRFKVLEGTNPPKILLVTPVVIDETTQFASQAFKGGTEKSKELIEKLKDLSAKMNIHNIDANEVVKIDPVDGVHFGKEGHKTLAERLFTKIKAII